MQRCLEVFKGGEEKRWVKEHLKNYMSEVRAAGTIWTIDWDRHPMPKSPFQPSGGKRGRDEGLDHSDDDHTGGGSSGGRGRCRGGARGAAAAAAAAAAHGGRALTKKQRRALAAAAAAAAEDAPVGSGGVWEWSAEEEKKRARRAGRFDGGAGAGADLPASAFDDRVAYMRHKKRLVEAAAHHADDIDWERFKIKGTCQKLEKSYLRLTSAPDPVEVRPPAVLRRALERLLRLVAAGQGGGYFYYNDQFKAMRQDLTVQGIRDELAVQVYEAHGRAALEYGDQSEYNQCQAQLALLYAAGQPGCHAEFAAYRLLYQAVHARHGEGRKLGATICQVLEDRVGRGAASTEVAHALQARSAIAARSYARFFRLYASAPNLGRAVMDVHVPSMRWHALNVLCRAYRPTVPVGAFATAAGFVAPASAEQRQGDSGGGEPAPGRRTVEFNGDHAAAEGETEGLEAAEEWLLSCGAVLINGPGGERLIDCKACCGRGVLHPAPEKGKVAHGDVNLDINDFLAKIGV